MNWFAKERQKWIDETVRSLGYINRGLIEREFSVSTPTASMDLQVFMRINPGKIVYNKSVKRYLRIEES